MSFTDASHAVHTTKNATGVTVMGVKDAAIGTKDSAINAKSGSGDLDFLIYNIISAFPKIQV